MITSYKDLISKSGHFYRRIQIWGDNIHPSTPTGLQALATWGRHWSCCLPRALPPLLTGDDQCPLGLRHPSPRGCSDPPSLHNGGGVGGQGDPRAGTTILYHSSQAKPLGNKERLKPPSHLEKKCSHSCCQQPGLGARRLEGSGSQGWCGNQVILCRGDPAESPFMAAASLFINKRAPDYPLPLKQPTLHRRTRNSFFIQDQIYSNLYLSTTSHPSHQSKLHPV